MWWLGIIVPSPDDTREEPLRRGQGVVYFPLSCSAEVRAATASVAATTPAGRDRDRDPVVHPSNTVRAR
jgi:hypothetical protein